MFKQLLTYKANFNNKSIITVDRFYPSSKLCHICGYKKIDLSLSDRSWICPICNTTHNRDYNASINILNEGLKSLSLGTSDYTDGANILSPIMISEPIFSYLGELVTKSEATKSLV